MPKLLYIAAWLLLISCVKNKTTELPQIDPRPVVSERYVHVSTAAQLTTALLDARPGDEIIMADAVYQGKFVISSSVNGTAAKPVILRGSRNVILDAGSITTGYVLYLQADYWKIKGFTLTNGLKGLMTDGASYNTIDSLFVHDIGEEAIHLRKFSSHNIIQHTEIKNTGLKTPDYGEGIYIGSAKNNWATYTNGVEDRCDSNTVLKNTIGPDISAECIDIKEGTTGGLIKENQFDATGITGANSGDSWIDAKGNHYVIESNTGFNPGGSIFKDGYQSHVAVSGWGNYNEFKNNTCTVNTAGYGFNIQLSGSNGVSTGNKVYSNNSVTGAGSGISNITLSN